MIPEKIYLYGNLAEERQREKPTKRTTAREYYDKT